MPIYGDKSIAENVAVTATISYGVSSTMYAVMQNTVSMLSFVIENPLTLALKDYLKNSESTVGKASYTIFDKFYHIAGFLHNVLSSVVNYLYYYRVKNPYAEHHYTAIDTVYVSILKIG